MTWFKRFRAISILRELWGVVAVLLVWGILSLIVFQPAVMLSVLLVIMAGSVTAGVYLVATGRT